MDRTPYQVVLRLYVVAEDYWEVLSAHFYQIDLMKLEPHRLLTLIYGWIRTLIPPDDWEMFEMELTSPLPGKEGNPSETEVEQEGDLFMTALQTLEK